MIELLAPSFAQEDPGDLAAFSDALQRLVGQPHGESADEGLWGRGECPYFISILPTVLPKIDAYLHKCPDRLDTMRNYGCHQSLYHSIVTILCTIQIAEGPCLSAQGLKLLRLMDSVYGD